MEKIVYLAEQLAKRIMMNWEFQLPTSFQDKSKAEELLDCLVKANKRKDK